MERFLPNRQVTTAQISSFLCFQCGDLFKNRKDYEQHVLNHQSIAIYNFLYHEDMRESKEKKRSGGKRRSSNDTPNHTPESITSRRHTVPPTVSSGTASCSPQGNLTLLTKDGCVTPKLLSESRYDDLDSVALVVPSKVNVDEQGCSRIDEYDHVSKVDELKQPAFQEIIMDYDCPANCEFRSRKFTELIRHCCIHHEASISSCDYRFDQDDVTVFLKSDPKPKPGSDCGSCQIRFETATDYYLHGLEYHLTDILGKYYSKKGGAANRIVVKVLLDETSKCPHVLEASIRILKQE